KVSSEECGNRRLMR
ncbi:hypothetical protein KGM_213349B, partial [Danaus plexippus plexippus]